MVGLGGVAVLNRVAREGPLKKVILSQDLKHGRDGTLCIQEAQHSRQWETQMQRLLLFTRTGEGSNPGGP